ncbi:DMT family transporter [Asinibacterium sp. OR53]|uniref:DMT family transporter n=1 Tax=Asinibacterium sp. OR53 TaxID=925409 RepID=UPI0004798298|nr:DMT family transporter [Asinibacterium sp. OR53]
MTAQRIGLKGFLITLLGAVFFSTKAIFVKLAFHDTGTDAVTLLTVRMLFSLPFYAVVAWLAAKKEENQPLTRRQWLLIGVMGILGYYLSSLFDFIGLQYVSAGLERLILFLYPTFAVLINTWYFKTALSKTQIAALLLTYLGIGIAYLGELRLDTGHPGFFYGSFMIFLCAITYSFYLVGTGRLVKQAGTARYTAYVMLAATVGVFAHFLFTHSMQQVAFTASLVSYGSALAIIATVLPSFMMSAGMKSIGSNNVAIITSIGPVSTILQAHFILGEPILGLQLAGTALVIIGVLLIGWRSAN